MASSSSSHKRSFSEFDRETFTVSKKLYDAFINHRGPDVKETVAFALYESLEEKDCWTFLDDQELELGDSIPSAIQNAIYSSSVQIAIFSPGYAESPWCLDELLLMLKTKARFIPVFCNVKPSDLRYLDKGVYKTAFDEHVKKGRISNERLNQWKKALHDSSFISGEEFKISTEDLQTFERISREEFRTTNDNFEMLCTKITSAVQQEVGKMRYTQRLHLSTCVCEILRHLIESITHRSGLHVDAAASTSTSAPVKRSSLLPRDSHPVGIDFKVQHMVSLLQDPDVQVIAVVGMGGLGKTFLLQNVYEAVKSRFDKSIWLSISKAYSLKNLQHDIASHIDNLNISAVTEERAAELIRLRLQGKKSLIVLDDLWTLSTEDNLIDRLGLPADTDCKVVVSTRSRQVALNSSAQIYEMQYLSEEESWSLFSFYAFRNRAPQQQLEEEGRKIVKQCGNLPLAIKTIAASLANTTLLSKWESKRRQLERVVTPIGDRDLHPVMDILKLSYDSLPAHLKGCFAYLSFFPDDEKIDCEYLIHLWIVEGLVPAGEEQWDRAWDWLHELAQLCLLQLWEDRVYRQPSAEAVLAKYCKIHDLLHDLAIHISRENKCTFAVEEALTHTSGTTGWCRILLAKKGLDDNAISAFRHPVYLRTLSLSQNWGIKSIPENLFAAMRGLHVLDLSFTGISTLPASLGKMILLKFLNLRETQIEEVPECVRHLKSLLFLAIPYSCEEVPVWISELICLQHLKCEGIDRMPKGISKLASLRTLRSLWVGLELSVEEDEFMRLEDLANMTQLQELWLKVKHEMELKRLEEGILAQLVKMRHLKILNRVGLPQHPPFPENMRAMKHLESLTLWVFAVPSWICELANMRELKLYNCECSDYPELQRMPNLVRLVLKGNWWCRELPKVFGKSGGFPRLRFFTINSFRDLEEFPELEEGALACLEELELYYCKEMKKVGEGLERLKRLKKFDCRLSGRNEWWETLKEGGEYWNKIKAINPNMRIIV